MALSNLTEHSVIALLQDIPAYGLTRGEMGTIVFAYEDGSVLVEFTDALGQTVKLAELDSSQLLPLHRAESNFASS